MSVREDILKKIREELPYLMAKYGVEKVGLFGSYSREEEKPESDIDILVRFSRPIGFFKFIAMEDYLKEKLGRKVDMVTEDALKPVIKPYVMGDVVYV